MIKRKVNAADYATEIVKALPKGILLTTKNGDQVDSMVIGWGAIGVNWAKPMFTAYVRKHRHTIEQLKGCGEFTVNIPMGDFDKKIIKVCGTMSGRDVDKVKEAGLTLVDSDVVSVPGVKELPLTLECKVIYQQSQELDLYSEDLMKLYPQDVDGSATGANRDPHISFFGEIVNAYIIEE